MYYKEEVINGVLCWKGSPNGEWHPLTAKQLTERLIKAEAEFIRLDDLIGELFPKK